MCLRSFLKVVSTTIGIKALQCIGFQDLDGTKCLPAVLNGLGRGGWGFLIVEKDSQLCLLRSPLTNTLHSPVENPYRNIVINTIKVPYKIL